MAVLYYPPSQNGLQKTLDAQLDQGATSSMTLNNTTGVQNKPGVVVVNRIDSDGNEKNASEREFIIFQGTSGSTLTTLTRGVGGSSDQDHAVNSVVEFVPDVTVFQSIIDALANLVDPSDIDSLVAATDSSKGAVELATTAETTTGTDATRAVTPDGLHDMTSLAGAAWFLDEDNMATDSATKVPSQQSVKAYVDTEISAIPGAATDGWISTADTWTYASATSFTIAGVDRTTTFTKGTRIKLTQTSAKYFVVTSSSFSTNTTVNVTGGSDYSLANAAITSPYYSYAANPQGYPGWFNYTPTGVAASNVTLTGGFAVVGLDCHVRMKIAFSGGITFTTMPTLPINAVSFISGSDIYPHGVGAYLNSGESTNYNALAPSISSGALTVVQVLSNTGGALNATTPITWANGDVIVLDFHYKI